jgi:hypothetical protein
VPGRFLYGVAGNIAWHRIVNAAAVGSASIDDMPANILRWWRRSLLRLIRVPGCIYMAGYSPAQRRIVGYSVQTFTGMKPELLLSGHHATPTASSAFLESEKVLRLGEAAERGRLVEEFHIETACHLAARGRAGDYGVRGLSIGGWAQIGRIDRGGVAIRDLCDLDADLAALAAA